MREQSFLQLLLIDQVVSKQHGEDCAKKDQWVSDGDTYSIMSTNKKVKVRAGTFKNVVEVKRVTKGSKEYLTYYYVQGVGLILIESTDSKSKKTKVFEVIKIK